MKVPGERISLNQSIKFLTYTPSIPQRSIKAPGTHLTSKTPEENQKIGSSLKRQAYSQKQITRIDLHVLKVYLSKSTHSKPDFEVILWSIRELPLV